MTGAGSRRKGHNFERLMVHRFAAIFGEGTVSRGLQYRDGADCPDVKTPVFWVECKRGKRTNPKAALQQALEAMEKNNCVGTTAIAVTKDDYAAELVTMRLSDFEELIQEWWDLKNQ